MLLDDVLHVLDAKHSLFSPGKAIEHGLDIRLSTNMEFVVSRRGTALVKAVFSDGMWGFTLSTLATKRVEDIILNTTESTADDVEEHSLVQFGFVNYSVAAGQASMKQWHERLGHTCDQYLKIMADQGHVEGTVITARHMTPCDACHLGKQRRKLRNKKKDRKITAVNQVVYADLMFPAKNIGTQFAAILVTMDGFSGYLTVHILKRKDASTVNPLMKAYDR